MCLYVHYFALNTEWQQKGTTHLTTKMFKIKSISKNKHDTREKRRYITGNLTY